MNLSINWNYNLNDIPWDMDVLLMLFDDSYAVGYVDSYGELVPSNVSTTYDGAGKVVFDSKPVAWVKI